MKKQHNIDFNKASFKDFEEIPNLNSFQKAETFIEFSDYMEDYGRRNYGFVTHDGCGPEILLSTSFQKKTKCCISLVSND